MKVEYLSGVDAAAFAEECASIHQAAFSKSGARGWNVDELEALFERPTSFLLKAEHGFLLADLVVDEVEILTISVAPAHQGQKIGQALLSNLDEFCTFRSVKKCLLEVAENNHAAISLYKKFGFTQIAIREGYFNRKDCTISACIMTKIY